MRRRGFGGRCWRRRETNGEGTVATASATTGTARTHSGCGGGAVSGDDSEGESRAWSHSEGCSVWMRSEGVRSGRARGGWGVCRDGKEFGTRRKRGVRVRA